MNEHATAEPVLSARGVRVQRGRRTVLDGIDLEVPRGQITGLLMPRDQMPDVLHAISDRLPLSYAIDAVNAVTAGDEGWDLGFPLVVIAGVTVLALGLAALTLRRRTP